jgi:hypothetical protein
MFGAPFKSGTTEVCWDSVIRRLDHLSHEGRVALEKGMLCFLVDSEKLRTEQHIFDTRTFSFTSILFNKVADNCIETLVF